MDPEKTKTLERALALLKEGKKPDVRLVLMPFVKQNPEIAEGWYLLGFALTDPEKRLYCFQQVLRIDPSNLQAQKQIAKLRAAQSAPPATPAKRASTGKKGFPVWLWALGGGALVVVCFAAFALWYVFTNFLTASKASLEPPVAAQPAVATATPDGSTPTLAPTSPPAFTPVFRGKPCLFDIPLRAQVRCGIVSVPQNRQKNDLTNLIDLPVVVYQSAKPNADVIIYLQGGPGSESIDWSLSWFQDYVTPILQDYDMVFFDPRGTGRSEPRLDCPELNTVFLGSYFQNQSADQAFANFTNAWGKCHDRFLAGGIDVSAFNTTESAADVRDIAVALGYKKVNLLGISYGTRLALTVMRDHPEIVRSAVIDSVVPMESKMFDDRAIDVEYALNKVFTDCANSPRCNSAYPNLSTVFYQLIERFDRNPVNVKTYDPYSDYVSSISVNGVDLLSAVVAGLHTSPLVPVIPKAIYDIQNGDYTFLSYALGVSGGSYDTLSMGTYFATTCPEQVYASTPAQMDADLGAPGLIKTYSLSSIFGSTQRVFDLCNAWRAAAHDPRDSAPVTADIPTLIISGQYDPTTPRHGR